MRRHTSPDVVNCWFSLCELVVRLVTMLRRHSRQTPVRAVLIVARTVFEMWFLPVRVEYNAIILPLCIVYAYFICFGNYFFLFLSTAKHDAYDMHLQSEGKPLR